MSRYEHRKAVAVGGAVFLFMLFLVGCTSLYSQRAREAMRAGRYSEAQQTLEERLAKNPNDFHAQRELGIAYYKQGHYDRAETHLSKANELHSKDERTILYLGLALERQEKIAEAIAVYESLDRPALRARLELLSDKQIRAAVQKAIAEEKLGRELGLVAAADENTLATTEFAATQLPDSLRPLGRGMAALLASDLARVTKFTVLERTRLQPLFDELILQKYELTDSLKNAAIGQILGAHYLCTGQLNLEETTLQARGQVVILLEGSAQSAGSAQQSLDAFYKLEKMLLAEFLKTLRVELTAEQERILHARPTRSLAAFLAFSRGLELWDSRDNEAALAAFRDALRIDPRFRLAQQELDWRTVAFANANDLPQYERLADATPMRTETEAKESEQIAALRNLQAEVNPNAIRWMPSAALFEIRDPRDLPYGDRYGPMIDLPLHPEGP